MKVFILTIDEPLYTTRAIGPLLAREAHRIAGAALLGGSLSWKRAVTTLRIGGWRRLLGMAARHGLAALRGGEVRRLLRRYGVPVATVRDPSDSRLQDVIRESEAELVLSLNCPVLLKPDVLSLARLGFLNVHFGLLPRYRGILPILYAILNRESAFGVTVHFMDERLDNGPILLQDAVPIGERDDLFSLYPIAFRRAGELLAEAVEQIASGRAATRENDRSKMTCYSYPDRQTVRAYRRLLRDRQRARR